MFTLETILLINLSSRVIYMYYMSHGIYDCGYSDEAVSSTTVFVSAGLPSRIRHPAEGVCQPE